MEKGTFVKLFSVLIVFSLVFMSGCTGGDPNAPPADYEASKPTLDRTQYYPSSSPQSDDNIIKYKQSHPFEISFIDVGFGDATLIRANGKAILFDAGPSAGASEVRAYLREHGVVSLDLLVLSSNDARFISGAAEVLRTVPVKEIWVNKQSYSSDARWDEMMSLASDSQIKVVEYGDKYEDGNFTLTALNPFPGTKNPSAAMDSIVLKAQYGDFCAVLFSNSEASGAAGNDAGTVFGGVDSRIISAPESVKCPVLRVSAHGSGNSASFQLLDAMGPPEMAVISVGQNPPENKYPEPTLIRRLLLREVDVYLTDKLGDIVVKSDGSSYEVETKYPYGTSYAQFINGVGYGGQLYYN